MSNWGISPNASEKEKIKAEYADILHGMNSTGAIPYDVYSDLFDDGMELLDRMYEQGKIDTESLRPQGRWVMTVYTTTSKRGRVISNTKYSCSECKHGNGRKRDIFCPNCGADMREG